jgi:hypothetical protein
MKRLLLIITLTTLSLGTGAILVFNNTKKLDSQLNLVATTSCAPQPTGTLDRSNIKLITLSTKGIIETGQIAPYQNLGYVFEAKAGENVDWFTKENLCVWVYSPSNKLLKNNELSEDGKYTIQISVPKVATSFSLAMRLKDRFQSLNTSIPTQRDTVTFAKSDYPKASCGDSLPTNSKEYPISFYPVELPYSISNITRTRINFCKDAIQKGSSKIQIASFTTKEKAQEFANFLELEIKGTMVGSPTTIQTSQEQSTMISSDSPEQAVLDYYVNINNRNYKTTWELLSSRYRDKKSISFSDYTEWWDTVNEVKISDVRLISRKDNLAYIDAQLKYVMKDGDITSQDTHFSLEWRQNGNEWIFLDVRGVKDGE